MEALGLKGDCGSGVRVAGRELERQLKGEALVGSPLCASDGGQPFEKVVSLREGRDPGGARHLVIKKKKETDRRLRKLETKQKGRERKEMKKKLYHKLHEL